MASEVNKVESPIPFEMIAPVIRRYAERRIECPDLQGHAVTLGWWFWHRSPNKRHLPASVWARVAVRAALNGRDIPGVKIGKFRDAMRRRESQGAGMGELADRRPGPLNLLIIREETERFFASLDEFEQRMCNLLADGVKNQEVARRMRRSPGAISQRRRRLMERHRAE